MNNSKHRQSRQLESLPPVAGNGLIDRRALLGRGVMFASAAAAGVGSTVGAAAEPLVEGPWSNEVGAVIPAYQVASRFEKHVVRTVDNPGQCAAQLARPHAASSVARHHHAERPALHDLPWWRAGHRSR